MAALTYFLFGVSTALLVYVHVFAWLGVVTFCAAWALEQKLPR